MRYSLNVNGTQFDIDATPDTPLLWALRDGTRLTGTKFGCGIAQCGACTVYLDGQPTRSCAIPVRLVRDRDITTIEGLQGAEADAIVAAWRAIDVPQCMLADEPRHTGVLQAVAELADWGRPPAAGRAFGVALHKSFDTYVAQIADVGLDRNGRPKVHNVWCAIDCGVAVNPNVVTAQMEGGIGFGIGAALYNEITLTEGKVQQSNFDDYRPLRIGDMPDIEVVVVNSREPPTGVGEPGVPLIAPAMANAVYRLTGERVRRLPFVRVPARRGTPA